MYRIPVRLRSLHENLINPASLDENGREYEGGAQPREEQEKMAGSRTQANVEEQKGRHLTQCRSSEYEEDVVASWQGRTSNRTKHISFHLPDLKTIGSFLFLKKRTENAIMTRRKRKDRMSTVITGLEVLSKLGMSSSLLCISSH